jgi:RNA polymerase sigma factor (sigma-70 family)
MYCIEEALPEEAGGGRRGQAVFVEEGWETQVFVPWEKDQPQFAWAVIFLRPLGEGFQGHKDKAAAYLETEAALLGLAQGRLVLAPDQQADLPQIAHTDPIRGLAASYALLRQGNFARLQAIGEVLQGLLPHSPDARLLAWLAASGGRLEWQQRHPETFQNPFLFAAGMEAFVRAAGRINVACPWNSRLGEIALLRTTGSVWVRWEEPITPPTLDRALQQLYGQIRENAPSPWSSSESLATYLGLPVSVIAEARRRVEGIFEEVRQSSEFERLIRERHRQWPHLWNLEECQEAIIDHIWKKLDQFEGKEKPQFLAWVRRLSWSVGVDRQRSVQAEKRARTGWADWLPRWVRPASEVVETKDLVERLLSGLNQRERQLVQLVYYDGLSFDKVAVALKTTKPALYQLHYRLLQKLRERAEALKTDR